MRSWRIIERVLAQVPKTVVAIMMESEGRKLLLRIHFIIVMIRWTGLAPWEFEFPFSLTSTFLEQMPKTGVAIMMEAEEGRKLLFKDTKVYEP